LRAGSTPSREEADRFYVLRVADYARTIGSVFAGLYLAGLVILLLLWPQQFWRIHLHPAKLFNLALAVGPLTLWAVLRRPNAPASLAYAADLGMPVGVMTAAALVAPTVPREVAFYFFPLLIAVLLLVVRAAVVPSSTGRTLLVGFLTAVPAVIAGYLLAEIAGPLPFTPTLVAVVEALWCAAVVVSTAVVSRVIYGLRREIASARRLGHYILGDLIGEGGMGAVYHAEHALLRRPTAVKLLLPERAGPENIARFEREVTLTARLTHPNTVAVYDYGHTPEGVFYYAMEYLDGLSLEELVRRFGPQPPARVIHVLEQTAGALSEAHALGLIHRDVKPANIILCERGGTPDTVKLLDFGLVKNLVPSDEAGLTHADAITGTPQYLSPEAILDPATIDARVDLYALGGVGYFLLAGRPPFEGRSVLEVCGHHLHTTPVAPSERLGSAVDPELEALVLRCLAKDRDRRPETALELEAALLACAERIPWSRADAQAFWHDFRAGARTNDAASGQLSEARTVAASGSAASPQKRAI
jgi:serine/threonine-protein kinase